jgi:hypothetical protein
MLNTYWGFKSKVWILRNQVHIVGASDCKLGMDCCTPRPLLSTFNNWETWVVRKGESIVCTHVNVGDMFYDMMFTSPSMTIKFNF